MKPKSVYLLLFLTSCIYAPLLTLWQRREPVSFAEHTWLTVVIGCGYILLALRLLLDLNCWLRVCSAFFFACIPIVSRSLLQKANHNRRVDRFERGR